jgi:hypothetical protein
METTFTGGVTRLWLYAGDPDTSVRTVTPVYAERGEMFMNTTTLKIFFCNLGGTGTQIWSAIPFTLEVLALIAAIPQSDWAQANVSSKDYIKNKPSLAAVATSGAYADLTGKPILSTVATTGSYNDLLSKPTIPAAQIQSDWTQSNVSALDYIKNKPTIPNGQVQSDWTQTNSAAVDFIKNKPAARSQSSPTRTLNTIFQISATRDALVNYSVDVGTALSLLAGQAGTVYLEISSTSGFGTVQEVARFLNSQTGTLTVGLALAQNITGTLSGYVPAGFYCRLRTENNTGTPSFTFRSSQEVLL